MQNCRFCPLSKKGNVSDLKNIANSIAAKAIKEISAIKKTTSGSKNKK